MMHRAFSCLILIACSSGEDITPAQAIDGGSDAAPDGPSAGVPALLVNASNAFCTILTDKTLRCWGENYGSQLGPSPYLEFDRPTAVPGIGGVIQLSLQGWFACGRFDPPLPAVACWGDNFLGMLGDGTVGGGSGVPVAVQGLDAPAVDVSIACARHDDGGVSSWGFGESAQRIPYLRGVLDIDWMGALEPGGRVTDVNWQTLEPEATYQFPADAITLSGSPDDVCALTEGGEVWCAGDNLNGIAGNGEKGEILSPLKIPVEPVAKVSVGLSHACAVHPDGTLSCWGDNSFGQLGRGMVMNGVHYLPAANVPGLTGIIDVAAAYETTCALRDEPREILCWGGSHHGMLGIGPYHEDELYVPTPVLWE